LSYASIYTVLIGVQALFEPAHDPYQRRRRDIGLAQIHPGRAFRL